MKAGEKTYQYTFYSLVKFNIEATNKKEAVKILRKQNKEMEKKIRRGCSLSFAYSQNV